MRRILCISIGLIAAVSFGGAPHVKKQVDELLAHVKGKRVAFLTNPTGVDENFQPLVDRVAASGDGTTISAIFAPEHGFRGSAQAGDKIADYTDEQLGVTVFSLYGSRRAPEDAQLSQTQVLVFDIQDVGARFYTYVWTMSHAMEAAARNDVEFVVFDRPNPARANIVEGPPNRTDSGLVGRLFPGAEMRVATRHGLTAGELAKLISGEWLDGKPKLTVIPVQNYTRGMSFEETGYPWVFPSPNMPTVDTAIVYTGTCIFEGSNMSEGRGTTKPFELIGAPYIDAAALGAKLNALDLPGVRFRPTTFTPTFSKHDGIECAGVQVHVTDVEKFEAVATGLHMAKVIAELHPNEIKFTRGLARLTGLPDLEADLREKPVSEIVKSWQDDLNKYMTVRKKYLIYND